MNKHLLIFLALTSVAGGTDTSIGWSNNPITITIGTKQPTAIYSIPFDENAIDKSCTFESLVKKLNSIKNSKRQIFYLHELVKRECTEQIGKLYKFKDKIIAPKGPGVIIVNKHGAVACKTDMDFAVRTGGKSKQRQMLTAGISSGGSKIICDYGPNSASVADIKKLDENEKKRLKKLQYTQENFNH